MSHPTKNGSSTLLKRLNNNTRAINITIETTMRTVRSNVYFIRTDKNRAKIKLSGKSSQNLR